MPTEAQINANRLNAQKSTGPTSPEGKARSALNALKSGIDAWSHIIPGEDPAELEALTAAFLQHYRPVDPVQLSLVDTLVSAASKPSSGITRSNASTNISVTPTSSTPLSSTIPPSATLTRTLSRGGLGRASQTHFPQEVN